MSHALRNRLYWTNIPVPGSSLVDAGGCRWTVNADDSPLSDKPSFDRRPRLNCLISKLGTEAMNKINPKLRHHYEECEARGERKDPVLDVAD